MWDIVLTYVTFFAYLILVILVGEGLQKKFNLNKEMVRKCEHLAAALSWYLVYLFSGPTIHMVIINLIGCIIFAFITFGNLMKSIEREDTDKSYGVFYFGLSTLIVAAICFFVNKDFYALTGIAYYCLALGDGFAPIFAKLFKKKNMVILAPKTLVGMLAVFVFSTLSAIVFNYGFSLGYSWLFMISIGCLATVLELFGKNGLDNFYIEFGVFGYLVMNYYGLVTTPFAVAIILTAVILILIAKTKALTHAGSAVSFVYLLLCAFCGGWLLMAMSLGLFTIATIVSKITTKLYNKKHNLVKEKHTRGAFQIIANALVASAFMVLYYLLKKPIFLFCVIVALAEEFADSMASDFGRLSRKKPIDILRLKVMPVGISGGISLFGTIMALFGTICAVLIPYLFLHNTMDISIVLIICSIAFFGTFVDSMLGSGLQSLYKCNKCQILVESKVHCQEQAIKVKGLSWMSNSMVNFLSGLIVSLLALVIFYAVI